MNNFDGLDKLLFVDRDIHTVKSHRQHHQWRIAQTWHGAGLCMIILKAKKNFINENYHFSYYIRISIQWSQVDPLTVESFDYENREMVLILLSIHWRAPMSSKRFKTVLRFVLDLTILSRRKNKTKRKLPWWNDRAPLFRWWGEAFFVK